MCIQDTEPTVVEKMRLDWVKYHRNHAGNDLTDEFKLIQLSHFIDKDTEVSLPIWEQIVGL